MCVSRIIQVQELDAKYLATSNSIMSVHEKATTNHDGVCWYVLQMSCTSNCWAQWPAT